VGADQGQRSEPIRVKWRAGSRPGFGGRHDDGNSYRERCDSYYGRPGVKLQQIVLTEI
jgi:hypothetical protein